MFQLHSRLPLNFEIYTLDKLKSHFPASLYIIYYGMHKVVRTSIWYRVLNMYSSHFCSIIWRRLSNKYNMWYFETSMKYMRFNFWNNYLYINFSLELWIRIDQNSQQRPPPIYNSWNVSYRNLKYLSTLNIIRT